MFELINGYEKQRAHREAIRREVAQHQQAGGSRPPQDHQPLYAAALAEIGERLIEVGSRLQARYGALVEENKPAQEAY